ncbi:MAG: hypothetical protein V3R64_07770, partial [Sphingomonadales bacterium]
MQEITGLNEIIAGKKAVLCDLWGVLHNGRVVFPGAFRTLENLRKTNAIVILLSNSPKPGNLVKEQIEKFNITENFYDGIVSSGDLAREFLERKQESSFFFIGP